MSGNNSLQLINERGWRCGFVNLLRKENSLWWRTRKWWVQSLIWLFSLNGIMALIYWLAPAIDPTSDVPPASEGLSVFVQIFGGFASIGVMILAQSIVVREKQSGTAAWIMSNPVSRSAFILSKLIANGLGILIIIVLLQSVVGYLQISLGGETFPPLAPFAAAIGLQSLNLLFYLTLALMLGAFFNGRGAVIGISIAVLAGQSLLAQLVGQFVPWLPLILPDTVMNMAAQVVQGQALSSTTPIISVSLFSLAFVLVAIWRFQREEF